MLARNVLIFHSGALGDFVLSFPLALALGRLYPTSRVRYITPLSKGKLAGKVVGVEYLDVEGGGSVGPGTAARSGWSGLFAEGVELRDDVLALLAGSHRVVSFVAGPSDPWGRRVAELAPKAARMFLRTVPDRPGVHAVDWLIEQCGKPECGGEKAIAAAVEQVTGLIRKQGLVRRAWTGRGVLLHPGAGALAKCWPLDSFRELALRLKDNGREVRWVLGEVELARLRADERRALEALGDVVVPGDYVALLEELNSARAFVGNDSGPTHLAAMEGVPTLGLYGPTDPGVWGPVGPSVSVLRGNPGGGNPGGTKTIDVNEVYETVERLYGA
jgi:heptosyltransferase III